MGQSRWAAVGAAVAVTLGSGGVLTSSAAVDVGERGVFVPIAPCRLLDTRPAPDNVGPRSTKLGPGDTYTAAVTGSNGNCNLPSDAVGVTMNVAIISPTAASFLTVFPADAPRPLAANANWTAGQPPLSNAVTTDLAADGRVSFYNLAGTVDVAADVVGYFVDHTHDDRYPTKAQVDAAVATVAAAVDAGVTAAIESARAGSSHVLLDGMAGAVGSMSDVAIGADGNPVVAYYDSGNGDLKVAACSDPSCVGDVSITTVDAAGNVGLYPSIAIGTDGRPVVSYQDATSGNGDIKVAACANSTCVGSATLTTLEAIPNTGYFTSIAIGLDGNPVLAYHDGGATDLVVAKCLNPACTGSPTITHLDTALISGYDASLAVRPNGNPIIAYYEVGAQDLRVAACTNPACTSAVITPVDSAGFVGASSAIAIASTGLPIIAYYDGGTSDLKLARCVAADCTGVAIVSTLESYGGVGSGNGIAIAGNGRPVIVTYDATRTNARVVICGTATCTGRSSATPIDAELDAGQSPSIAIGRDGLPVLSYYDHTNQDLRFVRCASVTCAP